MKINVSIPTNNYDTFHKFFFTCIKSFEDFKDDLVFTIIFQKYTKEQIDEVVKEFATYGLTLYYSVKEYDLTNGVPLIRIRNDGFNLYHTADWFWIVDDDIVYSKEGIEMVLNLLHQMEEKNDRRCSVIQLDGAKENKMFKIPEQYYFKTCMQLGLLVRNIYGGDIVPHGMLNLLGGLQSMLCTAIRLIQLSKEDNTPIFYGLRMVGPNIGRHIQETPGRDEYHWLDDKKPGTCIYALTQLEKQYNNIKNKKTPETN